ncbi:hypothetical protein AB192_05345 [Aliivibrio fischeri]|nr:hypothetical protein AB192_05345 [Aliivibrio fischeri]
MEINKTYISHSIGSFTDLIDSHVFNLEGVNIHCTFTINKDEYWFYKVIEMAFERGIGKVSLTDGTKYLNTKTNEKVT